VKVKREQEKKRNGVILDLEEGVESSTE